MDPEETASVHYQPAVRQRMLELGVQPVLGGMVIPSHTRGVQV